MDFLEALQNRARTGSIPVIPDIKCFSPKDGELLRGRDPVRLALALEKAGACALSVVTEEKEFHGSLALLREISRAVRIPVLRKDFIETETDLEKTREAGASAVLLMVSCLGEEKLAGLYDTAIRYGLVPFVETHTEEELAFAARLKAPLVGINNRNILELEKDDGDVSLTEALAREAPEAFIVAESGLHDGEDVRRAVRAGAQAALVGTAILAAEDPVKKYQSLTRRCGIKVCGIMDEAGAKICEEEYIDLMGIVSEYPVPVPWDIPRNMAKTLVSRAKGRIKTCIVTGGAAEKVIALAAECRPDYLQIHYREPYEETRRIAEAVKPLGVSVIRSIPDEGAMRMAMFGTDDPGAIVRMMKDTSVDVLLFDTRNAGNAAEGGGSILAHETELRAAAEEAARSGKKIMVGGGITWQNAAETVRTVQPDYIDIMTGAEDAPGKKSREKIRKIVSAVDRDGRCRSASEDGGV